MRSPVTAAAGRRRRLWYRSGAPGRSLLGWSLLALSFLWLGPAQAAVCTLAPGGGDWEAPGSWTGCIGGNGLNGPNTPGAGDTAIIGSGDTVTINAPESISTLQLNSGTVFIDSVMGGSLNVDTAFDWTGGSIDGFAGILTLESVSVSTWNGANLTVANPTTIRIQGTVNWTQGLIFLNNAVIDVDPGGIFNMNIGVGAETIAVQAPGTFGQIVNNGQVNKTGTQSVRLDTGVSLDGTGNLSVADGSVLLQDSSLDGSIDIAAAGLLRVEGTALFDATSFTGAGILELGPTTPVPGCNVTINGSFGLTGTLRIETCNANFGGAAASFATLVMDNPMAFLGGPAAMDVVNTLTWNAGSIVGGPGEMLTIGGGASAFLGGPQGPPTRSLSGRMLVNNGLLTVSAGNGLDMFSTATFQNGATGTIDFNMPAADVFVVTDDASGNQWFNDGNISLTSGQFVGIVSPLNNDGTITVNNGTLDLAGDGDGTGDYVINAPGALTVSTATRQLQVGSTVSGTGLFVARDGANVTANGSFAPGSLEVSGPSPALLSYTGLPNIPLDQLLILDDSTFETAGPVQVATTAVLESGTLRDTVGVSLVLLPGATAFLPSTPGSLFTFDDIFFFQSGSATWQGGGIHLDNNASWEIQPSGNLAIDSVTMSPQILGCSSCGSPTLVNQGVITKLAMGTGDDANINGPIQFFNEGSLSINGGELFIENFVQQGGGGPVTEVSGGALNLGISGGQFNTGFLQGNNGSIGGDVSTDAATIRPGNSPGTLIVTGDLVQTANSVLQAELGGTLLGSFDRLLVSGTATLAGTVNVTQFGGFNPAPPDIFNLVNASGGLSSSATLGANAFPGFGLQAISNELRFLQLGPSNFEVTTTLDPGDGTCDLAGMGDGCTLREAINAANGNAGPDLITFNIVGAGVQTIAPLSPLPPITDETFIDGLSQPGALGNTNPADMGGLNGTLLIELSGQNTAGDGLVIDAGSNEVIVLGLVINRWSGAGVRVNSTFAIDGSSGNPARRSRAFDRDAPAGMFATAYIVGNYIGTSADGFSVPGLQGTGVVVAGPAVNGTVFIGDGAPDGRNLISGHVDHGVVISADQVELNGNLIGTDVTGLAPLGNGRRGIHFVGDNAVSGRIGGSSAASQRNIISGNGEDGIGLQCAPAITDSCFDDTRIFGNYIGVGVDGTTPIPNANGINIIEMTYGLIQIGSTAVGEGNKIEFNLGAGVLSAPFVVAGAEFEEGRASINGNAFLGNGGPAIDLGGDGRMLNDALDADGGFNNGQNFPEITDFLPDTPSPGSTTVEYVVPSDVAESLYPLQVEFYRANGDEGFELLGTDFYLLAEAGMTKQFLLPGTPTFLPEDVIIATATDANGKTSEFTFYPVTVDITDDSPDPSLFNDPYTVEVTVTQVSGPFTPVGDVFVDDGEGVPQTCNFSLLVGDAGVGSCVLSSPATTGFFNLFAAFDGSNTPFGGSLPDIDPDGEMHEVNNPTMVMVTDLVDPTAVGEPFTLGVAVSAAAAGPATGTVDVTSTGGESCSIPLAGGLGSCQLTPLTTGPRTLTATYMPDPNFDASFVDEAHDVIQASALTTILSDLPDPSLPGQTVTVAVNVSASNVGNLLTPTGGVTVNASTGESCSIPSLDGSGNGSCDLVFNTTGMRTLTAAYAGDANFTSALSMAEPHDVNMAPPEDTTTTILSTTPAPSVVGQPYLVQVQVSGDLGNTPCGDVLLTQLPDGSMCTATLAPGATPGVAVGSCSLTAPSAITKAITGQYQPGACNFAGSQAALFTHAVNRAVTSTTITGQAPNPSTVGQPVTISFAVAVQAPGSGTPSGTVTVTDGIDVCQATLPASSCQLAFKTQGNRTLNVSYGGDADFNGSATNGTQQVGVVASGADLAIRKLNDRCVLPGGTRSSYRIEVSNLGPDPVTGARVQDTLPALLTGASWTCTGSGGGSCTASGNGNIDQLVNLPVGGSVVFLLSADVPTTPESVVSNTATVQTPSGVSDPVAGNNSSTDSDPIGVFCDGIEDPFSD